MPERNSKEEKGTGETVLEIGAEKKMCGSVHGGKWWDCNDCIHSTMGVRFNYLLVWASVLSILQPVGETPGVFYLYSRLLVLTIGAFFPVDLLPILSAGWLFEDLGETSKSSRRGHKWILVPFQMLPILYYSYKIPFEVVFSSASGMIVSSLLICHLFAHIVALGPLGGYIIKHTSRISFFCYFETLLFSISGILFVGTIPYSPFGGTVCLADMAVALLCVVSGILYMFPVESGRRPSPFWNAVLMLTIMLNFYMPQLYLVCDSVACEASFFCALWRSIVNDEELSRIM
jgi:hypothetical protein